MQMANMTTAMKLLEELRAASYDTAAKELKSLQGFAAKQVRPRCPAAALPALLPHACA
jgi:Zn-dependent oligopeptidase